MNNSEYISKLFDNNLPIPFFDVVNDNLDKIHNELYQNALTKFENAMKDINSSFSLNDYKIIELKDKERYLLPSSILMISKSDFSKRTVDLTDYWNTNYTEEETPYIFNELLINDENKKNIEIEDIDYVNGKIKFRNKFTNNTFIVDKNKIDFNITYKNKLENTFGNLMKNSKYSSNNKNLKSKVEKQTLDGLYTIK